MFLLIGLVPQYKLLERHFLIELGLVAPSGYLRVDVAQRMVLIVCMTHDVTKTAIAHQNLDSPEQIINVIEELVVIICGKLISAEKVEFRCL